MALCLTNDHQEFDHRYLFFPTVTQFILEQQDLKLKKNSKSRKKRKQNTDEEEGSCLVHLFFFTQRLLDPQHLKELICSTEHTRSERKFKRCFST